MELTAINAFHGGHAEPEEALKAYGEAFAALVAAAEARFGVPCTVLVYAESAKSGAVGQGSLPSNAGEKTAFFLAETAAKAYRQRREPRLYRQTLAECVEDWTSAP